MKKKVDIKLYLISNLLCESTLSALIPKTEKSYGKKASKEIEPDMRQLDAVAKNSEVKSELPPQLEKGPSQIAYSFFMLLLPVPQQH